MAANGLAQGVAVVKILLTRGSASGLGLPEVLSPTLVIWARPYEPPPAEEYAAGWPVAVFPERRTTFLDATRASITSFTWPPGSMPWTRGPGRPWSWRRMAWSRRGLPRSLIVAQRGSYFTPAAASALPG